MFPIDSMHSHITIRGEMTSVSFFRCAGAVGLLGFLASCAEFEQTLKAGQKKISDAMQTVAAAPNHDPPYWTGEGVAGKARIVVRLGEQRAYFYKGQRLVGESPISTGKKGFETPPGNYRVIQKSIDHVSNLYGDYINEDDEVIKRNVDVTKDEMPDGTEFRGAKMPYFLRFTRGYGMHAGFVPRYRASHGCIRMPREMAKRFFHAAELGTPVTVEQ
jgi:lipoprotein-anchoring transpeptidase ErfK/SrfK